MSELHLDVIQHRLKNRYKLDINTHVPHVPYLETIIGRGRGAPPPQEADRRPWPVRRRAAPGPSPRPRGEGFYFVDAVKGGVIPNQYIPAVEKGVREQFEKGIVSGTRSSTSRSRSSSAAITRSTARSRPSRPPSAAAFRKAFIEARPVLLEPIVNLEITVPMEKFGDISADLSTRRGHITGMDSLPGGQQAIQATRPAQPRSSATPPTSRA